jgi:ASC-1-like (ASCH) protein
MASGLDLHLADDMNEDIPQIIKDVGFDFSWSEEKVWALGVPVEEMDIRELTWHFAVPFLWENGVYNLTSQEVIDSPDAHAKEYERTMKADLIHPIDIMQNKGRWLILDGLHRLMKADILGMDKVQVRKIPREHIRDILENEPMVHEMKLQPSPFEKVKRGTKTIEVRLNDEKRKQVRVGDEIVFSLIADPAQKVRTEVLELLPFPTFQELFAAFPPEQYGGTSKDEYAAMYKYYPREEEEKYGVLGIKLRYLGEA